MALMAAFIFLLAIHWVIRTSTDQKQKGIEWTLWKQFGDLDLADDLAIFCNTQQQEKHEKTEIVHNSASWDSPLTEGRERCSTHPTTHPLHTICLKAKYDP
ncbi:hypothetical protein DPMN_050045 [Dreissena polymorpha]|uniref:Uncharacterized protein n=1 Tax=Dreissena polymorpha TaxID=45954 RepID=A0A9D4CGG2_DREPO|nr:hypothetical protein DPMN_050045 [Dreissena polymorpha]